MLHINTKNPSNTDTNTSSKPLFAFKPRQVLLSEHNRRSNMAASALKAETGSKMTSLTPEMKGILNQSILHYLHRNGFSKTLKRFQSEAQIQSDTWKASSLHLEDLVCKYNASNADTNLNTSKKPELENDEAIKKDNMCTTNEEITTKKKKNKGTVESDSGAIEDQSKVTGKKMVESGKNCCQISKDIVAKELETKPKKKKKTKHDLDSPGQAEEAKSDVLKKPVDETTNGLEIDDSTKKTKDKKRKGTAESDSGAIESQSKVTDKKMVESSGKNCGQISEDIIVNEPETKPKKKKKARHDLDSPGQAEEAKLGVLKKPIDDAINGLEMDGSTKKTKDKKKKSIQQDKLEPSTTSENEFVTDVTHKERKKKKKKSSIDSAVEDGQVNPWRTDAENEGVQPDLSKKEKKSSKKRKRSLPEENDHISTEITTTEESKRQKTETSKEENSKKEGSKVNDMIAQGTSNKQLDGQANGKLEINGGEKSGAQKSTKKHHNGSAEPMTVNAFQRVRIDQVEFAHERLQDNSYWAKDGAEIGYGAKAQEVLGQVRGRDFRHEKTKKKRGSYRGGLIDLQSHSVKFNYSDEE